MIKNDLSKSAKSYVSDVKKFMDWFSRKHGYRLDLITPADIADYREYMKNHGGREGCGAKPATINRALVSLRVFFRWLEKEEKIPDNPAEDTRPVKTDKPSAPKSLQRNEQQRLMRMAKNNKRDLAIMGLMLHAGLRVSEVVNLKRENISISEKKGSVEVIGKGNKYRKVPLNKTIRKILFDWLKENPKGPLFPNWQGNQISARGIFKLVQEYAYKAKIEKNVTPHTLRHTFCKEAIDRGIPLDRVARMAGHSTLDITSIYTTPSEDDLQEDSEKLNWE